MLFFNWQKNSSIPFIGNKQLYDEKMHTSFITIQLDCITYKGSGNYVYISSIKQKKTDLGFFQKNDVVVDEMT